MTPETEELYYFYRLWDHDFYEAVRVLKMAQGAADEGLKHVLLRDAIVSYARPFSSNNGVLQKFKNKLNKTFVPAEYLTLHNELIGLRDRIIAHSDLSARDPRVVNWSDENGKWFPMSLKNYADEFSRLRGDLANLEKMMTSVNERLKAEYGKMEDEYLLQKND